MLNEEREKHLYMKHIPLYFYALAPDFMKIGSYFLAKTRVWGKKPVGAN